MIVIHKFKLKDSELLANSLCLGNISKYWSGDDMEKTGLMVVYDFRVNYDTIAVDNI